MSRQSFEGEGGWSLPLTSILILVIAVLAYFFGWSVIVVVVVAVVAITLGTYMYDRLRG